jgi:hypothetical protein
MGALLEIRNLQVRFASTEAVRGISQKPEHAYTRSLQAAVAKLRIDRSRPLALVGDSTVPVTGLYSPHAE